MALPVPPQRRTHYKPRMPAPLAMEIIGICEAFRLSMVYLLGFQSFSLIQIHVGQLAVYLHSFVYLGFITVLLPPPSSGSYWDCLRWLFSFHSVGPRLHGQIP